METQREVKPTDFEPIAKQLAEQLVQVGLIDPSVVSPHVLVQSALEAVVVQQGEAVVDLAWKDGKTIRRYDEGLGFCGAPGKAVRKRCHELVLTVVPARWSPRRV